MTLDAAPERRLAAILAASIDGYALLMRGDDDETHRRVGRELDHLRAAILQASGTIFSFAGDAVLAEFASGTQALRCALAVQAASGHRMERSAEPIRLRIAVTAGEILAGRRHFGGAPILLAAGLGRMAPAGGIALPSLLHDQLRGAVAVTAEPIGHPELADLNEPVAVVSISRETCMAWGSDVKPARKLPSRPPADPRVSIGIVPFRAAGMQGTLGDEATDDVIRSLGGLATWLAVSRTPVASVHAPIDLQRVGQTSGARYILHGSVEAARKMLRLTVELNEAETGRVLWSDRFDHVAGQHTALRDDAAARVSRAIPPIVLQRERDRTAIAAPDALTANDLALQAFAAIMQPDRDSFAAAAGMLRQAEVRGGPHASTWFASVWWHLMAISQGWTADPAAELLAASVAAARLDRNDPAAMALLVFMQCVSRGDHALAGTMLEQVIDGAPFCGLAESLLGLVLGWSGNDRAAIFHAEQAEAMPALGPERAWRQQVIALTHYLGGRYSDAVRWARMSAMLHPGLTSTARVLAASLVVLGQLDEAQQAASHMLAIDPGFHIAAWRRHCLLPDERAYEMAQRLRLAGLPA
jgi:adenylate cyclase